MTCTAGQVINQCLEHGVSTELAHALYVVLGIALKPCDDSPQGQLPKPISLLTTIVLYLFHKTLITYK